MPCSRRRRCLTLPDPAAPLIEVSRQALAPMREHALDLSRVGTTQGERRQLLEREEFHAAGLEAGARRAGGQLENEEQLVYGVRLRLTGPLATVVVNRGQLQRPGLESRLLADFTLDALPGRLVHVGPATRQRPATVADFPHQQYALIPKHRAAHIDLGSRVADFLGEQSFNALELHP